MYDICKQSIIRGGRIAPLILPFKVSDGLGLTNPTILKIKNKIYINIIILKYEVFYFNP